MITGNKVVLRLKRVTVPGLFAFLPQNLKAETFQQQNLIFETLLVSSNCPPNLQSWGWASELSNTGVCTWIVVHKLCSVVCTFII